jgi:hypothetical protein
MMDFKYENEIKIFFFFTSLTARIIGVVTSLINAIIFSKTKMFKDKIFRYLLIHSIAEFFYFVVMLLFIIPYCNLLCPSSITQSYFAKVIVIYVDIYLSSVLAFFALIIEISITIQRYLVVTNWSLLWQRHHYLKISGIVFLISLLVYSPEIFFNKIVKINETTTSDSWNNKYQLVETGYGNKYYKNYSMFVNLLRGPIFVSALTILNLITLIKFKRTMKNKKQIKRISFNNSIKESRQVSKVLVTENCTENQGILFINSFISLLYIPIIINFSFF